MSKESDDGHSLEIPKPLHILCLRDGNTIGVISLRETMNIAAREHSVISHRPKLVIESYERSEFEGCTTHFSDP